MLSYCGITVVLPDKGGFSKAASFCHDHFPTTQRPFTKAIARRISSGNSVLLRRTGEPPSAAHRRARLQGGRAGCFSGKCKLPGPEVTVFSKEKGKASVI